MIGRKRDKNGKFLSSHGDTKTPLYRVWCAMRERCRNPHNKRYMRYGGRGISVCEEWEKYSTFKEWAINNGYKEGLTIDRIDNNQGYSPVNCRWATKAEQNRNYSRNHFITYKGQTKCISDWSAETGVKRATILWRIKNGKHGEEIFSKKDGRRKGA